MHQQVASEVHHVERRELHETSILHAEFRLNILKSRHRNSVPIALRNFWYQVHQASLSHGLMPLAGLICLPCCSEAAGRHDLLVDPPITE